MSEGSVRIITMENGTYQKTENGMKPITAAAGYWVAVEETELDSVEAGETVGVWTDPETNRVWVDKVIRLNDLTKALALGRMFEQKAIYDVANKTEITIEG